MRYKTLILKEGTKYQEFLNYIHDDGEWHTSDTPELRPIGLTMELVKKHYSNLDLTDVTLVTVEIKIIEE